MIPPLQAVVAAPGFCIGVRNTAEAVFSIEFLPPCAEVLPSSELAAEARRQVLAYLDDADFCFSLPVREQGTAFQRRVWAQIAAIPCHQTHSYGKLAALLGSAPRAVGQACGANPLPLVVPCHRVVAAGGGLGGFAKHTGGLLLDVKRWLLAHEAR